MPLKKSPNCMFGLFCLWQINFPLKQPLQLPGLYRLGFFIEILFTSNKGGDLICAVMALPCSGEELLENKPVPGKAGGLL